MPDRRPENVDELFEEAMRPIGGRRPAEINPACLKSDNADVVFQEMNLISEVKTLMEDPSEKATFTPKISSMYALWVRQGKVPPGYGNFSIKTTELPIDCATQLLRYVSSRVKDNISKANKQIKALKKSLNMPTADGLLVLCNSGNALLAPDLLLWALNDALRTNYSSIDWVLYFTHGLPVKLSGMPEPTEVFIQCDRPNGERMPSATFAKIQDAWMQHRAKKGPVRVYGGVDPKRLFGVRH